jgi:hypothetical protein
MQNKIIFFTVLLFVFCSTLFAAQKENRVAIEGLRPMSMGGAFTAISDDENAFFYNPAGTTGYLFQILSVDAAVTNATIPVINDTYNLVKLFNSDSFLDLNRDGKVLAKLIDNILSSTPKLSVFACMPNILFITSPIPVKENYLSFGLGAFSYVQGYAKFHKWNIPSFSCEAQETATGVLPVAFKISSLKAVNMPGSLSLGINFKYMQRAKLAAHNISAIELAISNNDKTLGCKPVVFGGTSFGIDLGAIYHLNPSLNFGINIVDIYNSGIDYKVLKSFESSKSPLANNYTAKINRELNIGVSYYPEKFYYWKGKYLNTNNRLALAFDLTDLTSFDKPFSGTFPKKIHIGAEYKYDPFVIRAGFNSGYPTIGCGIGTNAFQLEYAFYGKERGMQAGQSPEWMHRVKFSIKLGHRKGRKLYGKKKETSVPLSHLELEEENARQDKKLNMKVTAKCQTKK